MRGGSAATRPTDGYARTISTLPLRPSEGGRRMPDKFKGNSRSHSGYGYSDLRELEYRGQQRKGFAALMKRARLRHLRVLDRGPGKIRIELVEGHAQKQ